MLAEELIVLDGESPLWQEAQPLLNIALQLEHNEDAYSWHGWKKREISEFLQDLPSPCSLLAGVWESATGNDIDSQERLIIGIICSVVDGEIASIRTFDALTLAGLKPISQLEPGIEDALEIMRLTRIEIAPVAWALFTDKTTWNEWIFGHMDDEPGTNHVSGENKGEHLASLARQGRCVLMGSRATHHSHHKE